MLDSAQAQSIQEAAKDPNAYFYFEFYYNDAIMGYSDYVSAAKLAESLSSIAPGLSIAQTLQVTGYAAPEPTSGLLLLVGGALLGLRRKRRVA